MRPLESGVGLPRFITETALVADAGEISSSYRMTL
jgi:hypothetical protein